MSVVVALLEFVDGTADQVLLYFGGCDRLVVVFEDEAVDSRSVDLLFRERELLTALVALAEVRQLQN